MHQSLKSTISIHRLHYMHFVKCTNSMCHSYCMIYFILKYKASLSHFNQHVNVSQCIIHSKCKKPKDLLCLYNVQDPFYKNIPTPNLNWKSTICVYLRSIRKYNGDCGFLMHLSHYIVIKYKNKFKYCYTVHNHNTSVILIIIIVMALLNIVLTTTMQCCNSLSFIRVKINHCGR